MRCWYSNIEVINDLVKAKDEKDIQMIINNELFETYCQNTQEDMAIREIKMLNIHQYDSDGEE